VPRKPRLVSGVKGHNINEISFPGSPALWAGSFTLNKKGQNGYRIITISNHNILKILIPQNFFIVVKLIKYQFPESR
jgi:hypothetical protein